VVTKKIETVVEYCRNRIRRRLNLSILPDVQIQIRNFEGPDRGGHYKIRPNAWSIIEPAEFWCETGYFKKIVGQLHKEYPQLHRDTNWRIPLKPSLIEPIISFGSSAMKVTGGINWIVTGVLKNKEKYCAVIDVEVRPMFRKCGLANLMKHMEIELAKREKCDFIQTWHWADNPNFNAAIVPSLKREFTLYHGQSHDGDAYEDRGYVHLRYYFDETKKRSVRVKTKDGKVFSSPVDNYAIIDYLEACPNRYPGRMINNIEEYGKSKLKVRKVKHGVENVRRDSGRQRIFIAEGAAGFEYTMQRNAYRTGDTLSFCPAVRIECCEKSDKNQSYLNHVFDNIYEFHFKPISMLHSKDPLMRSGEDYILEVSKDLRFFYSTIQQDKDRRFRLKIGHWYKGCGALSIGNHRDSIYDKAPSLMKEALTTGKLAGISEKLTNECTWTKYKNQVKHLNCGKDTHRDMEEFKPDIFSPWMKKPVEFQSTDLPEQCCNFTELIFCIDITTQSFKDHHAQS